MLSPAHQYLQTPRHGARHRYIAAYPCHTPCMLVAIMRAVFQQPHDGDVCDALCDLLVSSAPSHMHAIQDALLDVFEPGCPPHMTVFAALESLCCSVPLLVSPSTLQRV